MKKMFLLALAATTVFISCNKDEIENLEIRNAHLVAVNEGLTQAAADLQEALAAANDDISMLELVIDTANESIAKLDADNAAQAALIADYETSIEVAEARIIELEDGLTEALASIASLEERVQELLDNPITVEVVREVAVEVIRTVEVIREIPGISQDDLDSLQALLDAANARIAELESNGGAAGEEPISGTASDTVSFGDWLPAAGDQTADYTQTRTGDDGSTESRDVIVTSNSVSEDITEEAAQFDYNDDGDRLDTANRTQTQYLHHVGSQSIFIGENIVDVTVTTNVAPPAGPDPADVWNVDGTQGGESLGITDDGEQSAPIFRYNGVDYANDGLIKAAIAAAAAPDAPARDYTYQRIHTQPTIETFGELFENEVYVVNGDNDGNGFAAGDTRQGVSLGTPDAIAGSREISTDITYYFPGVQADPADVWTISTSGLGGELLSTSDSSSAVYFFNGQNYLSLAAVTDAVNAANPGVDIDVDLTGTLTDATIEVYADTYDEETLTVNGQPDVDGTATGDVRRVNQASIPNGIDSTSTPTSVTIEVRNAPAAAWVVTDGVYTHADYPGYSFTVSPASFPLTGFLATFTVPAGEDSISNLGHAEEATLIANAKSAIEKIND